MCLIVSCHPPSLLLFLSLPPHFLPSLPPSLFPSLSSSLPLSLPPSLFPSLPPSLPPSLLQSCLKGLYLSWLTGISPIEDLIAELLTQFSLPPLNCLPVKRPFGALKEVVLSPIHEESSLPYTSTGAYKLLQSIG